MAPTTQIIKAEGRIDILVNNAGIGGVLPVVDTDMAVARKMFETNFFGALNLTNVRAN